MWDVKIFMAALWEAFGGFLAVIALPAIPLLAICLIGIAAMTLRELRK